MIFFFRSKLQLARKINLDNDAILANLRPSSIIISSWTAITLIKFAIRKKQEKNIKTLLVDLRNSGKHLYYLLSYFQNYISKQISNNLSKLLTVIFLFIDRAFWIFRVRNVKLLHRHLLLHFSQHPQVWIQTVLGEMY